MHTNTDLTKIDKLNYLVSLLEGTASRAIAGLPITEENYDAAVDIINKRFGKPQQLISAHMDKLLKISTCSTDKPCQLRYLYDKLNVNIRGLEALGVKSTQYGSLLIPIIMAKLPPEIRVHVDRNTTESILSVIQNEIEAREISEKIKAMTNIIEPKTGFVPFLRNNFPGLFQDFSRTQIDFSRTQKFILKFHSKDLNINFPYCPPNLCDVSSKNLVLK